MDLPLAGAFYSILIWPLVWAVTEEIVYVVFALWRRRLVPIIGAHYILDLATGFIVAGLPLPGP